jgi:hypothetical protein
MAFVNKATAFPAGEDASGREHVVVKGTHTTRTACDEVQAGISTASLKGGLIAGVDQVFLQLLGGPTSGCCYVTVGARTATAFELQSWSSDGSPATEFNREVFWTAVGVSALHKP